MKFASPELQNKPHSTFDSSDHKNRFSRGEVTFSAFGYKALFVEEEEEV
jgi:hypothetical protein